MKFNLIALSPLLALSLGVNAAPPTHAKSAVKPETTVTVGGAPMFSTKNIIENAVHSKDHTALVEAVKNAGLVETLKSAGPFTVFAPDNNAFGKIDKKVLDSLMVETGKAQLAKILTYHVVGKLDSKEIASLIKKGKGSAKMKTVAGGMLTAKMDGSTLILTDENGNDSRALVVDVYQSNGVIHSLDTVLMPK